MKTTIYKSLSNAKEIATVSAGRTIEKTFPDIDFENAAIIVNGKKQEKEYILKESDVVTIRQLPSALSATAITLIAVAVVAVAAGVVGGIAMYKAKQAAEEAEKELEKVKKLTGKNDIDNRPFLRGATNTVATGNSQPYICGRHLFTPYLLCNPFYKLSGTDGKDEYTYNVLECGFSKQIIDTISIDDIRIKKFNDATPQEGGFDLDGGQVFADKGKIEIIQPTKEQIENGGGLFEALPELNYKTVSKACNDEIPKPSKISSGSAEYLTYTLDANAMNVDVAISFPYGLYAYNSDNDKIETQVTITPQYSTDGGQSWTPFKFNNNGTKTNTFKRNVSKTELRYCAHHEFTLADYNDLKHHGQEKILLRVTSNGNDDDKIKNDCYVLFYQSVCFDTEKSSYPAGNKEDGGAAGLVACKVVEDRERAFCTILGLRVRATKINEDKLKKINIITQGTARTWNGTQWSNDKKATRNPASWALEILTSDSHPASRFDDREIDLESFGEFYEYCERNNFYFDHVITQNAKKSATIQHIMDGSGAVLYWDIYGRLAVAIDRTQENAIAVYNPQNIISISHKKTFGRRTDGLRIKYVTSHDDNFTEETYLLMREGKTLNPDSIIKDVTVTGITTHDHIVKYARRLMAIEALRPKTTTIEVGNEGVYFTPYSKILLQDDSLKIGLANTTIKETQWRGGLLKKIVLNEPVEFTDKACGVIINCFGDNRAIPVALKVDGSGKTDTLEVLTAYRSGNEAVPEAGNVVSFGELDVNGEFSKITTEYLISGISRSDKGFRLELVNYSEAVYESGAIPPYKSNISRKPSDAKKELPNDYPTRGEMADAVNEAVKDFEYNDEGLNELAELITRGVSFSSVHRITEANRAAFEKTANLESLQRKLDEFLSESNNNISVTKDEIMINIEDTERELRATLAVQAGAIQAMVEGGGTVGKMAMSLELPAMINEATYQRIKNGAGATDTNAVYGKMAGTDYYTIKGNATAATLKTLWEKLRQGGLLASQIELNADQIAVYNGDQKAAAFINGKLQADYIDVDTLATKVLELHDGGILRSRNYGNPTPNCPTFTRAEEVTPQAITDAGLGEGGFFKWDGGNDVRIYYGRGDDRDYQWLVKGRFYKIVTEIDGEIGYDCNWFDDVYKAIENGLTAEQRGFQIDSLGNVNINGNAILKDIKITGDSCFSGNIDSGPLFLSNELTQGENHPTVYTAKAGSFITDISIPYGTNSDFLGTLSNTTLSTTSNLEYKLYNCTYKGRIVKKLYIRKGTYQEEDYSGNHYFTRQGHISYIEYDTGEKELLSAKDSYHKNSSNHISVRAPTTISQDFIFSVTEKKYSVGKTFKLIDLPTERPSIPNVVYRNGNSLCIS